MKKNDLVIRINKKSGDVIVYDKGKEVYRHKEASTAIQWTMDHIDIPIKQEVKQGC